MGLTPEYICDQCRQMLATMKALPAELRDMPEAQDRVARLEAALDKYTRFLEWQIRQKQDYPELD